MKIYISSFGKSVLYPFVDWPDDKFIVRVTLTDNIRMDLDNIQNTFTCYNMMAIIEADFETSMKVLDIQQQLSTITRFVKINDRVVDFIIIDNPFSLLELLDKYNIIYRRPTFNCNLESIRSVFIKELEAKNAYIESLETILDMKI